MVKRSFWLMLALVALAGTFATPLTARRAISAPHTAADAQLQNVLVEGVVGEIRKLNPLLATYNPADRDITSLIFEGLMTTNDYGEIVPDLAASWSVTSDGLEYLVALRDDVLWQDGLPFTAEDVVFTMQLMSTPDFPGAAALYEFWRTVEVTALDTHTVHFRLTQPLASFLDQLCIGIVPAHVLQGTPPGELDNHPFNLSPIGTGPYQIETLTASGGRIDGIQLRVAPVYRQRPEGQDGFALDRVIFRTYPTPEAALDAFKNGEINSIGQIPVELQSDARSVPGLSLYTTIRSHVGILIYNWDRDAVRFVRNPRVRLALAQAVDRTGLVRQHLSGAAVPADSPLVPTSWAYLPDTKWPVYDPVNAQATLDTANVDLSPIQVPAEEAPAEDDTGAADAQDDSADDETAGEPDQADGEAAQDPTPTPEPTPQPDLALALTILTRDDPALVALVRDIAASWEQIGFTVEVEAVSADALRARLEAGDFDAALVEYNFEPNADPDAYVFWHQGQHENGQNYGAMSDRRISEALENARRDPYGVNRIVHYHRFQQLFAERAPALVLYNPLYIYGADTRLDNVQLGFLSSPSDRFRHIQDWTFQS